MIHSLVRKDIFTEIKQLIFLLEIDRYFIDPSKGKFWYHSSIYRGENRIKKYTLYTI